MRARVSSSRNTGETPLGPLEVYLAQGADFDIVDDKCTGTLEGGQTCIVKVTLHPAPCDLVREPEAVSRSGQLPRAHSEGRVWPRRGDLTA